MLLTILINEDLQRLDRYLARELPQYSRSYLQKLIGEGCVTLNGKPLKPAWKTIAGQSVDLWIPNPEPSELQAEKIPLDIVFEDEWLLVVNKPQGMVVHPAAGHRSGTLVNALLDYCSGRLSDLNGVIRPGIVHRIDKDTSGLILIVKDNQVHAAVADKIRRHEIRRIYQAVVCGQVPGESGTIDAPIGRDPRNRQRMAVVGSGKPSVTHFRVLCRFSHATLIEARLESGRTHQIRVHLQYIGHPVAGDPVYAACRPSFQLAGQALHASALDFTHPVTGQEIHLECPLPDYFQKLLGRLT
ncbi:MAG TPA: RNA pseudouridine synthase [Clostridiales bacterium]|nr:RNA pseudouridine synthase [Clostridiales bacterium]